MSSNATERPIGQQTGNCFFRCLCTLAQFLSLLFLDGVVLIAKLALAVTAVEHKYFDWSRNTLRLVRRPVLFFFFFSLLTCQKDVRLLHGLSLLLSLSDKWMCPIRKMCSHFDTSIDIFRALITKQSETENGSLSRFWSFHFISFICSC